mmetsp:Transcript_49384/g.115954  ORF Transcript_49384/g.115954 Transcript_49384/m.115954 type:complete len:165 (-) Transcript_49384:37-531(-)
MHHDVCRYHRRASESCCDVPTQPGSTRPCKCRCNCCNFHLKKVHFFWTSRNIKCFEWFADVLADIEHTVPDLIEFNIYLTQTDTTQTPTDREDGRDPFTGLNAKTHLRRPNFESEFQRIAATSADTDIGVFFCGPKMLSKSLYSLCRSSTTIDGTRFHYYKENF